MLYVDFCLPFCGHDEPEKSSSRGLYLSILNLVRDFHETFREVELRNQMLDASIRNDIAVCFAQEILKRIFEEIGDDVFALLVSEISNESQEEQMYVVFRYVDRCGLVKERFVGVVNAKDRSALSLKSAIESLFIEYME